MGRGRRTIATAIKYSATQHQEDTVVVTNANHGTDSNRHDAHADHHHFLSTVSVCRVVLAFGQGR